MNNRVMQFRVGVVVLATSIIGAILVTLNSPAPKNWLPGLKSTYQITIELERAPGIGPDTPVRKNGLLIGRVESVEDLEDHVAIRANIDKNRRLYRHPDRKYECVVTTSVLGDATVEFESGKVAAGTPQLVDGDVVRGHYEGNPLEKIISMEGNLNDMVTSLTQAGDEISKLSRRIDRAFGEEADKGGVPRLMNRTEEAMANLSKASQTVNEFFGDQEVKDVLREARVTMRDVQGVARDVREPIRSIDRNLKNLEGLTEPLGKNGKQVAASLIGSLDGLGRIVEELTVLTESLNNRDGTIGQLVHNREVYDNLNRLLCNSNNVVLRINDLSMRLRPILDDVRVFTDKIAREPGRFVSGALSNGPGIK